MPSFRHIDPALRLFVGADSLAALPDEIDRLRVARVVVLCGRSLAVAPQMAALCDGLGARLVAVLADVRPDSPLSAVEATAARLTELRADAVVAVGAARPWSAPGRR